MLKHYNLLMRIKLSLFTILFTGSCWATTYVFPGNAVAPLSLQNNDTLEVSSGTFIGGSAFTVMNGPITSGLGQSVTIDNGASLLSNAVAGAIYAPYDGPFTIVNNGTLAGDTSAILAHASNVFVTQNSAIPISGMIMLGDLATVNFNSSAGTDNFLYVGSNSTINFNSSGSPANGIVGAAGTIVNVNNNITLAPISFVDTININTGTTNLGNVVSLGKALNVANGATLALGSNTITGVGTITQAGTFSSSSGSALSGFTGIFTSSGTTTLAAQTINSDFRVTGGTTTVTGVGSFIIDNSCTLSGGTLDAGQSFVIINSNATMRQTGGTFKVNSSGLSGSFQISSGGSYIIDGGTFDRGPNGSTSWNNANFTVNGGTVNYANGITLTGGTFNIAGGTFNYTAPTSININGATINISSGAFIAPSTGSLFANPGTTVHISGGTADFSQAIFVDNDVTIYLSGQPNIILRNGQTFLSNVGVNLNIAFGPSSLPEIQFPNTGIDFSNPTINITNNDNQFVASGDYVVTNAAGSIIPGHVTLPENTAFQKYSLGLSAGGYGQIAFVRVVRMPLSSVATTPISQGMGSYLDQVALSLGSSNPDSLIFSALSLIQNSQSSADYEQDLFEISPQSVTSLPLVYTMDVLFQQIDTHLLVTRGKKYYSAGDELFKDDVWLAPLGNYAKQETDGMLAGYSARAAGFTMGIERQITLTSLLGVAGSYVNGRVVPTEASSSHTTIHTYQITGYGTFSLDCDRHLDWIVAYSTNMNYSNRKIDFMDATATSKYNANLYGGKLIFSKDIRLSKKVAFAPELNLEYVRLHQQGYFETGADGLDYDVLPTYTSLLRLGAGGWLTFLQKARCYCVVPQLYAALTYDITAASQNISANFVNTSPVLNMQATTPRLGGIVGGKFTFMLRDNLFIIADITLQGKVRYFDAFGDLRLKYYF